MVNEKIKEGFEERLKEMKENEFIWKGETLIEEIKKVRLHNLHDIYKQLLHIENTNRIDVVLATALSRKLEGIPIWLIVVGASGDMKSVQLVSLLDDDAYLLHNLTSKTLVNGYKDKEKHPDLAPKLNNKLVIISDMAQLLKLPPVEKAELWAQLRDLYDGYAGKVSGQGSDAKYDNLKVTLLAGSTPAIDGQILVHQDLGTRELIYRTKGSKHKEKVMKKCFENEETEKQIMEKLKEITTTFLRQTEIKRDFIPEGILKEIMKIATYITYMRATAEYDSYDHSLRNIVYPEEPTRIAKQLKRLYICLMSLAEDYPEATALAILKEIAKSSSFPIRIRLFECLLTQNEEISTSKIAETLKIGKATAQRELSMLWNVGIVDCKKVETNYPDKFYNYWKIDKKNKIVNRLYI